MNLHLVRGRNEEVFFVYKSFTTYESYSPVSVADVGAWAETNDVDELPEETRFKEGPDTGETTQFLLTEKQSALFLLRFK